MTNELTQAIAEALENSPHTPLCDYRQHFAALSRVKGAKRWEALRCELKITAPECTCWLGRLARAAGMEIPD